MTDRWISGNHDDMITMHPVTGGGHGYNVQLETTRTDIGSDFKRRAYSENALLAAQQVQWLMELAGGTWTPQDRNETYRYTASDGGRWAAGIVPGQGVRLSFNGEPVDQRFTDVAEAIGFAQKRDETRA